MGCIHLITLVCAIILIASISAQDFLIDSQPKGRLLTPEEGCGFSKATNTKIVGGIEAKPGAFPWITLVGYVGDDGEPYFVCGGALITSRHVLTAAHCVNFNVLAVRLGEHDVTTTTDGEHQDIKVNETVVHPEFFAHFSFSSDIAILKLERDVEFNDRIRPICLPLTEEVQRKNFVDSNPFAAGWGSLEENTRKSDVLMQVQIPVIDNAKCQELYRNNGQIQEENQYGSSIMCAGYVAGGKDVCQGDSGGPLMMPVFHDGKFPMYQIGIVSTGDGCARPNLATIYTRVSHFIEWIKNEVSQQ